MAAKAARALTTQGPSTSTEDEDLNRAIQDSLMTASFHSASAQQNTERPQAAPREDGACVLLRRSSRPDRPEADDPQTPRLCFTFGPIDARSEHPPGLLRRTTATRVSAGIATPREVSHGGCQRP